MRARTEYPVECRPLASAHITLAVGLQEALPPLPVLEFDEALVRSGSIRAVRGTSTSHPRHKASVRFGACFSSRQAVVTLQVRPGCRPTQSLRSSQAMAEFDSRWSSMNAARRHGLHLEWEFHKIAGSPTGIKHTMSGYQAMSRQASVVRLTGCASVSERPASGINSRLWCGEFQGDSAALGCEGEGVCTGRGSLCVQLMAWQASGFSE